VKQGGKVMALFAENQLMVNRHCLETINRAFDAGLILTSNAYWTGLSSIAGLQAQISAQVPSASNPTAPLHETYSNFARHVNNMLTAARTYGVLIDANIATVASAAASARQATFEGFFAANVPTGDPNQLTGTEKQCQSFSGTAG
jgi:hypothetical protein